MSLVMASRFPTLQPTSLLRSLTLHSLLKFFLDFPRLN